MSTDCAPFLSSRLEAAAIKATQARCGCLAWGNRSTLTMVVVALLGGCATSPVLAPTGGQPDPTVTTVINAIVALGEFPKPPDGSLPEAVTSSLQSVLDEAVVNRTIGGGVTAGVILAGSGSWSGASGMDVDGEPLKSESQLIIASIGKTVTAAQVMRMVDEGMLGLLDPATAHLPPEAVAAFKSNGASVRDLLGMRSGLQDPPGYEGLVDSGLTPVELLKSLPDPAHSPGATISYVNMNYVLLGMIIEHETGVPLATALESGVLSNPRLSGINYPVTDALAADGWMITSDALTVARWGYDLYGGFVVSEDSRVAMTDFRGDWYGLGTIDFQANEVYEVPAIGHGGLEPPHASVLVVFPTSGLVVAVQAHRAGLDEVRGLAGTLQEVVDQMTGP